MPSGHNVLNLKGFPAGSCYCLFMTVQWYKQIELLSYSCMDFQN